MRVLGMVQLTRTSAHPVCLSYGFGRCLYDDLPNGSRPLPSQYDITFLVPARQGATLKEFTDGGERITCGEFMASLTRQASWPHSRYRTQQESKAFQAPQDRPHHSERRTPELLDISIYISTHLSHHSYFPALRPPACTMFLDTPLSKSDRANVSVTDGSERSRRHHPVQSYPV
jgi:hypothetical protein